MDNFKKPKVQVTEEDKQKSYYKYYERELAQIDPEKAGKIFGPPMNPVGQLAFVDRAKILEPGFDDEIGYTSVPDGTGYISDCTFIPGGTPEMIDWYFAWRGLDPLRFAIINPMENIAALSMQSVISRDPDRTIQEKYWDTTQEIKRMGVMGPFGPPKIDYLSLKCPSSVGFDMSKIGPDQETKTLVCGRNFADGNPPSAAPDYFVCHQVKEADGGVIVRTRIWYGWTVMYGNNFKSLPDGFIMQPMVAQELMIQNATEWANVAAILPQLYAEEKDNL